MIQAAKDKPQESLSRMAAPAPGFEIKSRWAGAIPFEESLKEQERLKPLAKKGKFCFFGFEPLQPVISHGLRSGDADVLWPESRLKSLGIKRAALKRGGEATLHAPGQLVIYPVMSLPLLKIKVRDYILCLEDLTRQALAGLGIQTERLDRDSGLSTQRGKIAFFGIHVSEGVSQHGLSINAGNDLSLFSAIKSCGRAGRPHDSLYLNGCGLTAEGMFRLWTGRAACLFGRAGGKERGAANRQAKRDVNRHCPLLSPMHAAHKHRRL